MGALVYAKVSFRGNDGMGVGMADGGKGAHKGRPYGGGGRGARRRLACGRLGAGSPAPGA